jgi:hypothetical protein
MDVLSSVLFIGWSGFCWKKREALGMRKPSLQILPIHIKIKINYVIPVSRWLYSLIFVWFHWDNSEAMFFKYIFPPAIQTGIIHHHQHHKHQWIMFRSIPVRRIKTVPSILLWMYFITSAVHFIPRENFFLILWNQIIHYGVQRGPLVYCFLSEINAIHLRLHNIPF